MTGWIFVLVVVAAVSVEHARACQPLLQPARLRKQKAEKQAVLSSTKEEPNFDWKDMEEKKPEPANITTVLPSTATVEAMCVEDGNCTKDADCLGGVCRTDSQTCRCACDVGRRCEVDSQCGLGGVCGGDVTGGCVCGCVHLRQCTEFTHCGGHKKNSCSSKCIGEQGVARICDTKTTCARGTQCMSGVCLGGGRLLDNGETVGVSCTTETADSDCAGIGTQTCIQDEGVCIQHANAALIGEFNCTTEGISAVFGFPTCVSGDKQAIVCGGGNMCASGAHCGLCDCNL
uniref:Uncharacterized protein n=1 Tax=Plectus sambesii TaxID=2011161 RepID=A0A914W1Y9_9BILA